MNSFLAAMEDKARRLPPRSILALGLAWMTGVGVLDCILPKEMAFSLLYLPGVAWVAWGIGPRSAAGLGAIAAVVITATDSSMAAVHLPAGVLAWNVLTRTIVFGIVGWLTAEVRRLTRHLTALVELRTRALKHEVARHKSTTARLAEAMDLARLAHWDYDVASQSYTFDDRFFALYGTTAEHEGGRRLSAEGYIREFVHPEDVPLVEFNIARAFAAPEQTPTWQLEHRIRRRDGEIRHLQVRVVVIRNAAGQILRLRGVNQDITERKQAEASLLEAHNYLEQRVEERTAQLQATIRERQEIEEQLRRLNETLEQRVRERTAALRESEERFRTLSEASFEGILLSKEGRIVDCNDQIVSIFGYSREELLGRSPVDLAPPEWRARVLAGIQSGRETAVEHEVLCKDGSRRIVEIHGRSPNGPAGLRLSAMHDVTDRKNAEQRLADALELNRTLIANAPIAIAAYKASGQCVLANEALAQAVGGPLAEVRRQNFRQLNSWRRSPLLEKADAALRSGQAQYCEVLYTSSFNHTVHLSIQFAPFASKGEPHLLLLMRDITLQKAAEQHLAEALELNRALIAHAPIGITAFKADGTCVLTNEAMAQIIGGSVEEVSQKNFRDLESWRCSPLLETADRALRTGQAQRCEFRGTTSLGRNVFLAAHFVPFANKGEPHFLVLVRDITESKRAERLLQVQRDLGVALSLTNELGTAFNCLLDAAMELEAIDCGGIYMVDTHSGGIRLAAHRGVSAAFVERVTYHPANAPQTQLVRQGQPVYTHYAEVAAQADALCEGLQAVAIIPLCYENTVIGSLNLGSHSQQAIPPQTRVAVETIAAQTAGAIARLKAETALRESERRLRTVITGAPLFLFAADHEGRITFEDGQALRTLGLTPGQLVGKKVEEVYQEHPLVLENMRRALRGEEFSSTVDLGTVALDCWYSPMRDAAGNVTGYMGVATNITERLRLERQLLEVSEREQARMGQDIHDGLCQQLVSLAFDANSLEQQLTATAHSEAALARRIAHYLDQAITETRQLSRGLFPIRLEGEGLPSALEELARTTSERFRIRCVCDSNGPVSLKHQATATHLYRIAQEAVNNALKHARPRTIFISLQQRPGLLELRVEDDGTGLPSLPQRSSRGMGLHIMDYRTRSLGGRLELRRNPNGGTTVCCCVPCQNS